MLRPTERAPIMVYLRSLYTSITDAVEKIITGIPDLVNHSFAEHTNVLTDAISRLQMYVASFVGKDVVLPHMRTFFQENYLTMINSNMKQMTSMVAWILKRSMFHQNPNPVFHSPAVTVHNTLATWYAVGHVLLHSQLSGKQADDFNLR